LPNEFWWADFIRRNDQDNDGPPLLFVTIRIEHRDVGRPENLVEVLFWWLYKLGTGGPLHCHSPSSFDSPGAASTEVLEKSQKEPNFSKRAQFFQKMPNVH